MRDLAIITTKKDISLPLFFSKEIQEEWRVTVSLYEDVQNEAPRFSAATLVYCRDPFTTGLSQESAKQSLRSLLERNPQAVFVDGADPVASALFEDKWRQYQACGHFMPQTCLAQEDALEGVKIYKKRISSRSRGIAFAPPREAGEYIVQERLDIEAEYRVIEVRGVLLPTALVKRPKTENATSTVQGARALPEDVKAFLAPIRSLHGFDLVGYDVCRTRAGELFVLEINRSPQINAYERETGLNPFRLLLQSFVDAPAP